MSEDLASVAALKGVIPYINVDGAMAAADFYKRAFGADEVMRMPAEDGKRLMHCLLRINDGPMMLSDTFPEHGHGFQPSHSFTLQLVVEDAQPWWDRAVAAGCEIVTPLQVMFWGDRWGQLRDPYKVNWAINAPVRKS